MNRRTVLMRIAAVIGGIGAVIAAVPFVRYLVPSKRAEAEGSPISVDVSSIKEGEVRAFEWRGQSVLVMRRGRHELDALDLSDSRLLDDKRTDGWQPDYIDRRHRSINPEILILLGNCTHLGCVPQHDRTQAQSLLGDWWPGGFTCACHGSVYDYAGRVVRGPAPRNLKVPPYYFESVNTVVIGANEGDV